MPNKRATACLRWNWAVGSVRTASAVHYLNTPRQLTAIGIFERRLWSLSSTYDPQALSDRFAMVSLELLEIVKFE
jgi:hypothetical protein